MYLGFSFWTTIILIAIIMGVLQGTCAYLILLERKVATVPGITFGPSCDRFVRVAFTISDESLREGLQRLRDYIEESR